MGHAETKRERLDEMERLLADRPWTVLELAEQLGMTRQSIYNYLTELEANRPVETDGSGRYWIDRATYVSNIALNLDEALVLYLAARRQQRQTWQKEPAVAGALSKLARALGKPMVERLIAAANQILEQEPVPTERHQIVAEVVRGWANSRVLHLRYRGLTTNRSYEDRFKPYLIEPSLWGDGVYVIGHSEVLGKEATYKIDRIERATCSGESFEIPDDFDESALFERAWGIWAGEAEPERVRLRFVPGPASRRVRESAWHHTAQRRDLPDGGCELTLEVSEVTELIPWIRSWGPQVEVLEPQSLRDRMMGEARRLAEIYDATKVSPTLADTFDDFFGE